MTGDQKHHLVSVDTRCEDDESMDVESLNYATIVENREIFYNLDYPKDNLEPLKLDPTSRFYSRRKPRSLNLPLLLPYKLETPKQRAQYLSHIVSHLYIAIKSLDIQGLLTISNKDLVSLKEAEELTGLKQVGEHDNDEEDGDFDESQESDLEFEEDDEEQASDDDTSDSANQHKKSPKSAALVGVRVWTQELLIWLKMKFDMPVTLRISLVKVYYALCLCRGQDLNLKTYVKAFDVLTKDSDFLRDNGLELDWQDLCLELENHFPQADALVEVVEKKDHKQLLRLAEKASSFYDSKALPVIFSRLASKFTIANASLVLSSMSLLPFVFTLGGRDDPEDIRHYVPSFFYMWKKLSKSAGIDSHLTARLGTVAMMAVHELAHGDKLELGDCGVFTEAEMAQLINVLINSLSIMNDKYGSLKTKFFHGFASAIVFSLHGTSCGGILSQLKTLLNAIESYVHPSNSGEWSRPISKLITSLVYQMHKRYNMENEPDGQLASVPGKYRLHPEVVDQFVEMMMPVVRTGLQSKSSDASEDYLLCLALLAHMRAEPVLTFFVADIYESLEGVISSHRVTTALRAVEELSRYFAATRVFRVHMARILSLAVLGIDSNDLEKTIHTLNTFANVANFIPFYELHSNDDDEDYDGDTTLAVQFTSAHLEFLSQCLYGAAEPEQATQFDPRSTDPDARKLEARVLRSSTRAFRPLLTTLCERIFTLLQNIPDPSKSNGIEKDLCDSLPKFLYVIFEALSPELFLVVRDEFMTFITENTCHTVADVVAECFGALVKREPAYIGTVAPMLMDRVRDEITENGAGVARTGVDIVPRDRVLFWNLVILNECLGNAGAAVVSLGDSLTEFSYYLMENVRGPAVFSSSYLVNQTLQAVTKIKLNEARLISPAYEAKHGVTESCWGGFQFDPYRFSRENLSFDWLVPTQREVSFAVELFIGHVDRCLRNIASLINQGDIKDSKVADEFRVNFLYLSYALSGMSFLFDPSERTESARTDSLAEIVRQINQPVNGSDTPLPFSSPHHDVYTSSYFFTHQSPQYVQIHRVRRLVGQSLHIIGAYMAANFQENTRLFKHYLYAVNIYFADVGRERVLEDSHAKISASYVGAIQHINRVRKPYTRVLMGARVESYHLLRVALHATARAPTELDRVLVDDVVRLSFSPYAAVSSAAQLTLADAMKRLSGTYSIIMKLALKLLTLALDENNHKKIESGLCVFGIKRIRTKLQNDYYNLQRFIELLHRSLLVDDDTVNEQSNKLFKSIYNNITPPASVCLIDHKAIDSIRPPDSLVDLEIKTVTLAKQKKRSVLFERLRRIVDAVVLSEKHNTHWKTTSLNLYLLLDIELDLEVSLDPKVLQIITNEASNDHPLVSRLALKGLTKMVSKYYQLQIHQHSLENIYSLHYVPHDYKVIDTSDNFSEKWSQEITSTSPSFFIDKASSGWLFWDKSMLAISSEPCLMNPLDEEKDVLKVLCDSISKSWFKNIVGLWIADNETTSAYQGTDVFFTAAIVLLMSCGIVPNFSFDQLLEVIEEVYVADEKSSHIVVCELLAGILVSSKHITASFKQKRDDFVVKFLTNIFEHNLSPDTAGVWNIFSWWVPSHVDSRQFPEIAKTITQVRLHAESDSAIKDATRLSYLRSMVASVTWQYPNPENVLQLCLTNIANRYQAIRDQVGSILAVLGFASFGDFVDNGTVFTAECQKNSILFDRHKQKPMVTMVPQLFDQIETWRLEVCDRSPHEILNSDYIHASTTVLTWLRQALNTSIAVVYDDLAEAYFVPFLLKLINMKEVCQLGNIDPITPFKKVSQIPFSAESLDKTIRMLERYSEGDLTMVQTVVLGEFTETVFFKNLFVLSANQRQSIVSFTNKLLYHKNVVVRESAAATLSGLIHTYPVHEVDGLVEKYISQYSSKIDQIRRKHRKSGFKKLSPEQNVELHASTLGLGALVNAFPFASPPPKWVPHILTIVSNKCSGVPGVVGKTAKETLGKFKKSRQDSWHVDSKVFTEEQMQDLEGVLWKSYFI